MSAIDIFGIDPAELVAALYNAAAVPDGVTSPSMTVQQARVVVERHRSGPYVVLERLGGRTISVWFSDAKLQGAPSYDQMNGGNGACEAIVARLRERKSQ